MFKLRNPSNYYFWLLILVTLVLVGLGLTIVSWSYNYSWVQTIWHVCQSGVRNLGQHLAMTWQLVIMAIISVVVMRGGWSVIQQMWSTRRLVRLFFPLRESPPARLQTLLETHGLPVESVVYLNLANMHAFCLGFWRPRIWLTAGLIEVLTDTELDAVLAHEAYHYHRRDPLRLLIGRVLKSAFFFLPLMGDLAKFAELQQEVAADRSAIAHAGDDLPLLCALQKLLAREAQGTPFPGATFNPFNVTEVRLRRLIYPTRSTPFRWRETLATWTINLGVMMVLSSISFMATQPIVEHGEVGTCAIEEVANPLQTTQWSLPNR